MPFNGAKRMFDDGLTLAVDLRIGFEASAVTLDGRGVFLPRDGLTLTVLYFALAQALIP